MPCNVYMSRAHSTPPVKEASRKTKMGLKCCASYGLPLSFVFGLVTSYISITQDQSFMKERGFMFSVKGQIIIRCSEAFPCENS